MLSIIIPTFNESRAGYLPDIFDAVSRLDDVEVLVVDGGSEDGTLDQVEQLGFKLFTLNNSTRAARLKFGIEQARGETLFLHHPRSLVSADAFDEVLKNCNNESATWGGLTQQFDLDHWLLRFTSWYSNAIRCDRKGIVYLDHCLFFHRRFVDKAMSMPDVAIFEDTELSLLLRRISPPIRLKSRATTSAIRFQQNGILRQAWKNQLVKLAYNLGLPSQSTNKYYEKGLDLNK